MLDSEFWRDLAKEFCTVDPYLILRADWQYVVKVGQQPPDVAEWRIVAPDRFARSIQFEFEALARRGGPKIYPKMDSRTGWLEALRQYRLNAEDMPLMLETKPDGTTAAHIYCGSITAIRQASVDLCKILESMALETERMEQLQHEIELKAEQQRTYAAMLEAHGSDDRIPDDPQAGEQSTAPDATTPQPVTPEHESIAAQLERLKEEGRFTLESLAVAIRRDPTTVARHLSGILANPQSRTISAYERVFSKALGRKIVIHKTPVKRR